MLQSFYKKGVLEAGCDEAGRGCLAGPVVAAAVILPSSFKCETLNDSKKISAKKRLYLRNIIEEKAISWAVASVSNEEIDEINISNATFLAMHQAVNDLATRPELLLIDGNRFKPYLFVPHQCIIKGDSKFASIAAASILAKTYRDDIMKIYHDIYPNYAWNENKAYPTLKHRKAIKKFGSTLLHRKSFKLL